MPKAGIGPKPEDQHRRQRNENGRAQSRHHRRHPHIAGAANDRGERVVEPERDRACEHHVGIDQRRRERRALPAHRAVEHGADRENDHRREQPERERDPDRLPGERVRILLPRGTERTRDRGENAAAHRAGGDHHEQHLHRKHERQSGERIGAELGDEIGLDQPDRGLDAHDHDIGHCQPQDRAPDRGFQQDTGTRVHRSLRRLDRSDVIGVYAPIDNVHMHVFWNACHAKPDGARSGAGARLLQLPCGPAGGPAGQPVLRFPSGAARPEDLAIFDPRQAQPARADVDQRNRRFHGDGPHHHRPGDPPAGAGRARPDRGRRRRAKAGGEADRLRPQARWGGAGGLAAGAGTVRNVLRPRGGEEIARPDAGCGARRYRRRARISPDLFGLPPAGSGM